MLISTVNLLAAGGDKIVEVMTAASVPSTLVKCLYLFFDLTATEGDDEDSDAASHSSQPLYVDTQKAPWRHRQDREVAS